MAKCPICNATVQARGENPSFPFCTARCKMIDLGKWLSEEYRVPIAEEDSGLEDEDGGSSDDGSKSGGDVRH
jgi:endogenous inhibitor of DNA gyrase (YacG/DUF329 family)